MSLSIGTKLGGYEILGLLGKGGMGEVHRARDTRLGREVALKVLPDAFAQDPDRLSRFQREAQVLASLNHSNIAQIYGLEESDNTRCIVMELVEGETLEQRLKRGPIPLDEALQIARQIAEALEAAHERGIVHRDLKPGNIKLKPDGKVKVLDFGLAKALENAPAAEGLSNSPTLSMAATQAGVIFGTAAYMSPEQAKGKAADARSDNWSFGVLLYEMLSGKPAFAGETIVEILGGVLKVEPDWDALPATTPAVIRSLLRRCLQKDPKRRMKDIVDATIEIDEALSHTSRPAPTTVTMPAAAVPSRNRARHAWTAAALVLLLIAGVSAPLAIVHLREPVPDTRAMRFVITAPENAAMSATPPAISPDGRRVAFVATLRGRSQLWIRTLESVAAQPLAGTDAADYPFWSPDSRFIGFFAGGKLKKIDASGGPPQILCDAPSPRGGTWNRDGVIVFTPTIPGPLHRVSSSGGTSTPVTEIDVSSGETNHRGASFLPDGRHFLFFAFGGEKQGIYVGSLDARDRQLLLNTASAGVYAEPGFLLFIRDGSLMAQPLDVKNFQFAGEAFPIAESVGVYGTSNLGVFSVSDNGSLVHGTGSVTARQLAWFDRAGKLIERIGLAANLLDLTLSPDQKRAAVQLRNQVGVNDDIWVVDLMRGVLSRLTFHTAVDDFPVWSPDGSRILFNSTREGAAAIYQKIASGAGSEELLFKSGTPNNPTDWSHDGRYILYDSVDPKTRNDIWVLPLSGDRKPQLFLQTPFAEQHARFSPDAKWIAYISDESGRDEVYVQSFPPSGAKWQVSTTGGWTPRWRRDGKELFYLTPDRKIMSVEVRASGAGLELRSPKVLFEAPVDVVNALATNRYDVSPDGQRFLVNASPETTNSGSLTVIVNWLAGVKK